MQSPRRGAALVRVGARVYVLGGDCLAAPPDVEDEELDYEFLATAEHLEVAAPPSDPARPHSWVDAPPMHCARSATAAVASGPCIYVFGGECPMGVLASAERFDTVAGVWSQLAPMGSWRWGPVAAAVRGRVYVFGGWSESEGDLASAEYLEVDSGSWRPLPPMGTAHVRFSAIIGDKLSA
mmetsp:Transcript_94997/g.295749  ORF Transcript_94997/g.295749 Transcript_94997/m.295749 type:complete len:181 (+) Transcript_94997:191-733(+)